jgi:hypothetical protein
MAFCYTGIMGEKGVRHKPLSGSHDKKRSSNSGDTMSIRALALELYRAQKKVAELQKAIEVDRQGATEQLGQELRAAEKEMTMLRKMLDGEKESGEFRKKYSGFDSWKA